MKVLVRVMLIAVLVFIVVANCTPMRYGVPLETWNTMTEQQRQETIRVYNERQLERQKERQRRERERAERQARKAEEARRAEEQKRADIEALYRAGQYGDLVRVTIKNGLARFSGKYRNFDPVSFKVANGDTRKITVTSGRRRSATLWVTYEDGVLLIDSQKKRGKIKAARLVYESRWRWGKTYKSVNTDGYVKLRNADVYVEIVPIR